MYGHPNSTDYPVSPAADEHVAGPGEVGIIGTDAVFNPVGVRVRDLPISVEDLLGA